MDKIKVKRVIVSDDQRETDPRQVAKIYAKIKERGYNTSYPITIDENNVLVDGGHRLEASILAGLDELPYVLKPNSVSSIKHAINCNEDGADTRQYDVFDYAEYCWKQSQRGVEGKVIADSLGWKPPQVSKHVSIKSNLYYASWHYARCGFPRNETNGNGAIASVGNSEFPIGKWTEFHFRELLSHLSPNGETDHATMRSQLAIIRECIRRWTKTPRDAKGNYLKVTARWIGEEAEKLAWKNLLKRLATKQLKDWVKIEPRKSLFKNINSGVFGDIETDEGLEQFQSAIEALNGKHPELHLGSADNMGNTGNDTIDIIITSPPYNLKKSLWRMGGQGRTERDGIGYDSIDDDMPEPDYQAWQLDCLKEMYRVAKDGASLFYNHKVRNADGVAIFPHEWLLSTENPWTLRQEILWDRGSTHNHNNRYFWPEDERIFWMTKGSPTIQDSIGLSTVWKCFGPTPNTWHPAPFTDELPRMLLKAIGGRDKTVLDPFAGSGTVLRVALSEFGYNAVGYEISQEYIDKAIEENGWRNQQ